MNRLLFMAGVLAGFLLATMQGCSSHEIEGGTKNTAEVKVTYTADICEGPAFQPADDSEEERRKSRKAILTCIEYITTVTVDGEITATGIDGLEELNKEQLDSIIEGIEIQE